MNLIKRFCKDREIKNHIAGRRDRLFRTAYSWCHNRSLSDDLTQETLAKALKKYTSLKNPESLDCWLYGILANCWRDHFRQTREHHDIDDYDFTLDITPESQYERHVVSHTIIKAVSELPAGQRQVVTLVDLEGFSYAEVAGILKTPIGTVMSRLCRARKSLAKKLLNFKSESTNDKTPFIRSVK
ncbi:MAG TPA: RNA polymerase sigma factor [Gammaproteobacteria bacterium]|nr:RNA polymerase sigma factor [Gammaproteobacteria bacterium]